MTREFLQLARYLIGMDAKLERILEELGADDGED